MGIIKLICDRKEERVRQGRKVTAVDGRYFKLAENLLYGGLPTLLLNKPVDFLFVFIQCHFQFPIQQILCQFKITPIHRRNFSALPDTLFFPVADQFDDPHQTLRIIAGDSTVF